MRRGLFKESVDEKVSGGDGMTPLMLSSERGDVEAIRLLLCAGTMPKTYMCASHSASVRAHPQSVGVIDPNPHILMGGLKS